MTRNKASTHSHTDIHMLSVSTLAPAIGCSEFFQKARSCLAGV